MGRHDVPEDLTQSVKWFTLSAEQGHAKAQNNLAILYEFGKGVAQDNTQAQYWYTQACTQGHEMACENLTRLKKGQPIKSQKETPCNTNP